MERERGKKQTGQREKSGLFGDIRGAKLVTLELEILLQK